MLNTRVFTLRIFTNQDGVDVVIRSLVALDGNTRANVGEEVEGASKSQIQGDMALTNYLKVIICLRACAEVPLTGCCKRAWHDLAISQKMGTKLRHRTFESDSILFDRVDSSVGDDGLAALEDRGNADLLPLNRDLRNA